MESANKTALLATTTAVVRSPIFLTSMWTTVLIGVLAVVANALMVVVIPKSFKVYQTSLRLLLLYSSIVCLLLSLSLVTKCLYVLHKVASGSAWTDTFVLQ